MIRRVEDSMRSAGDVPDPERAMAMILVARRLTVPGVTVDQVVFAISSEHLPVLGRPDALHAIAVGLAERELLPAGQVAA